MRLDDATISMLKKLAKIKGVDVSTLIRGWIKNISIKSLRLHKGVFSPPRGYFRS